MEGQVPSRRLYMSVLNVLMAMIECDLRHFMSQRRTFRRVVGRRSSFQLKANCMLRIVPLSRPSRYIPPTHDYSRKSLCITEDVRGCWSCGEGVNDGGLRLRVDWEVTGTYRQRIRTVPENVRGFVWGTYHHNSFAAPQLSLSAMQAACPVHTPYSVFLGIAKLFRAGKLPVDRPAILHVCSNGYERDQ